MIIKNKKLTGRQKRKQDFQAMHARSGLNLVSLMDIFTILVFFLLVNSGAQQLPSAKNLKLPSSNSNATPKENLILTITGTDIVLAGHKVANVTDIENDKQTVISALVKELKYQASNTYLHAVDMSKPHAVTIMGDENIPYAILSKVLASCRSANFTQISFAAYQRKKGDS